MYEAEVDRLDVENCAACAEAGDQCLYHEGFEAGYRYAEAIVKQALMEPDQVELPIEAELALSRSMGGSPTT